jgi:PIN domain nuclease of toxin-antitoxin system
MILLDTCALIWFATDWDQFSKPARAALSDPRVPLAVSAFSTFEIGLLHRRGRIQLEMEPDEWFRAVLKVGSITVLPVTWEIALQSTRLAAVHNDPADRIVIATAVAHGCPVVTSDEQIGKYPEANVIW